MAYDLVEIKNRRRLSSTGVRVPRIRTFPISSESSYESVAFDPAKTRLSELEIVAEE